MPWFLYHNMFLLGVHCICIYFFFYLYIWRTITVHSCYKKWRIKSVYISIYLHKTQWQLICYATLYLTKLVKFYLRMRYEYYSDVEQRETIIKFHLKHSWQHVNSVCFSVTRYYGNEVTKETWLGPNKQFDGVHVLE